MFIQKYDKSTYQNFSWITASLQFAFHDLGQTNNFKLLVNLNIKLTTNENCIRKSVPKKLIKLKFGSVFRRIENQLHMVEAFDN